MVGARRARALLCSVLIRDPPRLLPLAAGVAVAEVVGAEATIKWPNDVLLGGRKVAGILVEGRPQERWAVLGIGLNVALRESDFPAELRDRAATLGLEPDAIEPTLATLLRSLERWIAAQPRRCWPPCAPATRCWRGASDGRRRGTRAPGSTATGASSCDHRGPRGPRRRRGSLLGGG